MRIANEKYQEVKVANAVTLRDYLIKLEGLPVTSAGRTQIGIPATYGFLEETWTACHILISGIIDQDSPPDVVATCIKQAVRLLHYGEHLIKYFKNKASDAHGAIPFDDLCLAFQMVRTIFLGQVD